MQRFSFGTWNKHCRAADYNIKGTGGKHWKRKGPRVGHVAEKDTLPIPRQTLQC